MPRARRLTIIAGILAVSAMATAAFFLRRPLLERWYLSRLDADDRWERRAAIERLGELRSLRAVPRLLETLRYAAIVDQFPRGSPVERLHSEWLEHAGLRGPIVAALERVGPEAMPLVLEEVRQSLERPVDRETSDPLAPLARHLLRAELMLVFGRWGSPSLPALLELLADERTWFDAASGLGVMGSEALPVLIEALESETESVRCGAALALGLIQPPPAEAVPELVRRLREDAAPSVRRWSARAIGEVAPPFEAERILRRALEDADEGVRQAAAAALKRVRERR